MQAFTRPSSADPSSMSPENGQAHFDMLLEKARLRKRLFKEYLTRHQVLERFNSAIEALFEQQHLPEDPFAFIKGHIDCQLLGLCDEEPLDQHQQPSASPSAPQSQIKNKPSSHQQQQSSTSSPSLSKSTSQRGLSRGTVGSGSQKRKGK